VGSCAGVGKGWEEKRRSSSRGPRSVWGRSSVTRELQAGTTTKPTVRCLTFTLLPANP